MKYDKDKVEAKLKQEYFARKVDFIPTSLKETYSDLVSKEPVLVSRELIVDGRPLIGIEYAPDGEIASVYTTDNKGKRVNFENTDEEKLNAAPDILSRRLANVKNTITHNAELSHTTPAPEVAHTPDAAKPVSRKLDSKVAVTRNQKASSSR